MNVPQTQGPLITEGGSFVAPMVDANGAQLVAINDPVAAYGSVTVTPRTPIWNIDCTYGVPSGFYVETSTGSTGATSGADGAMVLSTGTGAGGFVSVRSQLTFRPRSGRGVVVDVCAKFSSAQTDNYQLVGPYTAEDGVALAYDNTGTLS